jgi:DNA (cytosine-5)-methyltransferase 1
MLRTLDLFSGIGGISLGLERTGGFETAAFCENDKKAQLVLKKHWPSVPIFEDVSTLSSKDIDGSIDVICGGFPCQDISVAGFGAGLEGKRSGLWWEFHRLIKEIKPQWVIAENVSALRSRGLDQVLRSLDEIGYDAEWHCIPASAVGAPHQRDRIWIIAFPSMANTLSERSQGGLHWWANEERKSELGYLGRCCSVDGQPIERWWTTEPELGRVAHGVSGRTHRLKQLGNAVVPQIPELIGQAIIRTYG